MSETELKINGDQKIAISGALNFANVSDLYQQGLVFLSQQKSSQAFEINLQEVTHSDSSGMALLTGWLRYAKQHGIVLSYLNPPSFMRSFAEVSGISELLPWGSAAT